MAKKGGGATPKALPIVSRDPLKLAADPYFNTAAPGFPQSKIDVFLQPPVWSGILTPDYIPPDAPASASRFLKWPDGTDSPIPLFTTDHQGLIKANFSTTKRTMPDGASVEFWGFFNPDLPNPGYRFPNDAIRIVEGQYFHCLLSGVAKHSHTIHWHGIEPTGQNDGVGKLSMEVGGGNGYMYQWVASAAGFYFFHCHRNTLLHFEMGMYGVLLIDPLPPQGDPLLPPYPTGTPQRPYAGSVDGWGGPGYVRRLNDVVHYDKEAIWVCDDVDPVWHTLDHGYKMASGGNTNKDANGNPLGGNFTTGGILYNFVPKYFCISGEPHPFTKNYPSDSAHPGTSVIVGAGQTLLARVLSGAYSLDKIIIEGLDAEVIAMDGRCCGQLPYNQYSKPFTISAGVPFFLTAARRFDLLIKPTTQQKGRHRVTFEFLHHITRQSMGIAETYIDVV